MNCVEWLRMTYFYVFFFWFTVLIRQIVLASIRVFSWPCITRMTYSHLLILFRIYLVLCMHVEMCIHMCTYDIPHKYRSEKCFGGWFSPHTALRQSHCFCHCAAWAVSGPFSTFSLLPSGCRSAGITDECHQHLEDFNFQFAYFYLMCMNVWPAYVFVYFMYA